MHKGFRIIGWLLALVLPCVMLTACEKKESPAPVKTGGTNQVAPAPAAHGRKLVIWSGSENRPLEPLIQARAKQSGDTVTITFMGTVDISRELKRGKECEPDAIMAASSTWITVGDTAGVTKHAKSLFRSPVVLGVKRSVAERLGWVAGKPNFIKRDVTVKDIQAAAESGKLNFAMTSATQSNSGASAYLGFLYAFAGSPEVLKHEHLADPKVAEQVSNLLGSVHRSAGSSGWLADMIVDNPNFADAMFNYEATIIETNEKLIKNNAEPLYVVYPSDGLSIADSPFAYVNKGDADKEEVFKYLQSYLLSPDVQAKLLANGRRTGITALDPSQVDLAKFNPDWGIDVTRVLSPITIPREDVIREALTLYQTAFRKPSLTVFVLDYSGSMALNGGEKQLKEAMGILLDTDRAAQYLLQPSARDVTIVIPFSTSSDPALVVKGNNPDDLRVLLNTLQKKKADGGTNLYTAAANAYGALAPFIEDSAKYHISIIVMTDGIPDDKQADFSKLAGGFKLSNDVPIYSVLFGIPSKEQKEHMDWLSGKTYGKVFDGTKDLVKAMREAKGFN